MKNLNFARISLAAVSLHLFVFKGVEKKQVKTRIFKKFTLGKWNTG